MLLYRRLPMIKDVCMQNSELTIIVQLLERFCRFVVYLAEVSSRNVTPRTGACAFVHKYTFFIPSASYISARYSYAEALRCS